METASGPLRYENGAYVLNGPAGQIFISADAVKWAAVSTGTDAPIVMVQHDGQQWVAGNRKGEVAFSADLNTWTPFFKAYDATKPGSVMWRGRFWATGKILGVARSYLRGHFADQAVVLDRDWDGQLLLPEKPVAIWRVGERLHLLREDGQRLISDNGEYWNFAGAVPRGEFERVYYAEGNGLAVTLIATAGKDGPPVVLTVGADTAFASVEPTSMQDVRGLAYGAGRFVLIGKTATDPGLSLYESADGKTWQSLGPLRGEPAGLTFGRAGFAVYEGGGTVLRYRPEIWPETPSAAKSPVEIPELLITDFGPTSVGSGKQRRSLPPTPDQVREKELYQVRNRARNGDVAAKLELAFVVLEGKYVLSNPWRAELWFNEARAAGEATAGRGYAELLKKWRPDTARVELLKLYRESATRGDATAMRWLAINLSAADIVEAGEIERWRDAALAADPDFAAVWAKRESYHHNIAAAEAGDVAAILTVLPLMLDGGAVPADTQKALELNAKAVARGRHEGSVYLARHYQERYFSAPEQQSGLSQDDYVRLLEGAVESGNKPAFGQLLNNLVTGGFGYRKDEARAYALALKLAEAGDADGMAMTAGILIGGGSALRDEAAGLAWMQKAADAGHLAAKTWLQRKAAAEGKAAAGAP